jgi:hypothetical protein
MKKTLVLLGCALFSLAACEKENVKTPCEKLVEEKPYAQSPGPFLEPLQTLNIRFYIAEEAIYKMDSTKGYVKYPENELKLMNEKLEIIPFQMDDPISASKNFAFVVKGKDLYKHPAFRANVPVSHTYYLIRGNKTDTLRVDSHLKEVCNLDSLGYVKCYQNNRMTMKFEANGKRNYNNFLLFK